MSGNRLEDLQDPDAAALFDYQLQKPFTPEDIRHLFMRIAEQLQRLAAALAIREEQWTVSGCRQLIAQFVRARSRPSREMLDAIAQAEQAADDGRWQQLLLERQKAARQGERTRRKLLNR